MAGTKMKDKAPFLPPGVELYNNECRWSVEENDKGEPVVSVYAAAAPVAERYPVRLVVPSGVVCHALVEGTGSVDLIVTGDGDGDAVNRVEGAGDAVREGKGRGDASRHSSGTGKAVRDGSGEGDAMRGGAGKGSARRRGSGDGDAVRWGAGWGAAMRSGSGGGNAVRTGDGAGWAERSGSGDGDAIREGAGDGNADRYIGGAGKAVRKGKGKGHARTAPKISVEAWQEFAAGRAREMRSDVLGCKPGDVHAKAKNIARKAFHWLQIGGDACLGVLLAQSPELAKTPPGPGRSGGTVSDMAKDALVTLLSRRVLGEMRAIREAAASDESADAPQEGALGSCLAAVLEAVEESREEWLAEPAREVREGLALELAKDVLHEMGLDMKGLVEIFEENPDLWKEKVQGETPREQMTNALRARMEQFALGELDILESEMMQRSGAQAAAAPAA